jgi:Domain of unknown function (DUF4864)
MHHRSSTLLLLAVVIAGGLSVATAGEAPSAVAVPAQPSGALPADTRYPDPRFSPADVVRIQLQAMQANDIPHRNAGIEIAFRFASPRNKMTTGPLARFIDLVHNPVYRAMLNHRRADLGQLEIEDNKAVQPVIVTGSNGERTGYLFALSKQGSGRYVSCWMTDAVIRIEIGGSKTNAL